MTLDSLPDIYSSDNRCASRRDRLQTNQLKKNRHDIDVTTSRKLLAKTPTLKTRKQKEREKKACRNLAYNQNLRLFGKGDGCEAEGSLDCKQSRSTNTHTHTDAERQKL